MPTNVEDMTVEELESELQTEHGYASDQLPGGTDTQAEYRGHLERWVEVARAGPDITPSVNLSASEDGKATIEIDDGQGNVSRVILQPTSSGKATVTVETPDGASKSGTVEPGSASNQGLGT